MYVHMFMIYYPLSIVKIELHVHCLTCILSILIRFNLAGGTGISALEQKGRSRHKDCGQQHPCWKPSNC